MQHFFVTPQQVSKQEIRIEGSDVNHMKNVLRMRVGDQLSVSDGNNRRYLGKIVSYEKEAAVIEILEEQLKDTELSCRIYLFQGLPKNDKMDVIVQKAVELGAYQVIPVLTKRVVVKLDEKRIEKRRERLQSISKSAAKQSGRTVIPEIGKVMKFSEAISYAVNTEKFDHIFIPYELSENMAETKKKISQVSKGDSVAIFIGPEGGFEKAEVEEAVQKGAEAVTLGRRILRSETAGITMLSILMYHLEW